MHRSELSRRDRGDRRLVVGLDAYAPTAWFAVLELGVPAAITGGVFGFIAGIVAALVTSTARRVKRHHAHSHQ